jgi:hypothetical protein
MSYSKPKPPKNSKAYEAKRKATVLERLNSEKQTPEPRQGKHPYTAVTQQIIDDVCLHIAEFGEPLEIVCRRVGMPSSASIRNYCKDHLDAAEQIENARKCGVYTLAFSCRDIARGKNGSSHNVVRDKLIIDTDMRILTAIAPREFGTKQTVDVKHTGEVAHVLIEQRAAIEREAEELLLEVSKMKRLTIDHVN